jgi:phosphomannomutase
VSSRDLSSIFKAYDVRGVYPVDLDDDVGRRIGAAFAMFAGAPAIALGRDARLSSPALAKAIARGVTSRGVQVIELGLASTDLLYFASGALDIPGVMLTASHNPAEYNGMKFCLAGASPVGEESGLRDIRALAEADDYLPAATTGTVEARDLLDRFAQHVLSFVDLAKMRRLKVVADTANGMGGLVVPAVLGHLPVDLTHLYPELDGTFPNHPADPIDPANQVDLKRAVLANGADLGLAFDGDADRCFVVDEKGEGVSGSLVTALVAKAMLAEHPGSKVVHNVICSWTVPEVIRENGGSAVRTRVGHSFIKQVMAETGAIFGGEHSGHYYFRDNYRADSGLIAAVVIMQELSRSAGTMSELFAPFRRYAASGEINSKVADQDASMDALAERFSDGSQDRVDGLTVGYDDWWFNVRPSNTEPLLRLNVEAKTEELLEERTELLLGLIRGGSL